MLDRRHQQVSTILSSNIKLSGWGKYLGDATLAAAILDRLAMNSIRIDIDGPSYRQHIARKRASELGVELETAVTPNSSTLRDDSGPLETKQPTP